MEHFWIAARDNISIDFQLNSLLEQMWTTDSTILQPSSFLDAFRQRVPLFKGHSQHDAQEFIRYLLDLLIEENSSNIPVISNLFQGQLSNEVQFCLILDLLSKM